MIVASTRNSEIGLSLAKNERYISINDAVYGHISLHPLLMQIIQTHEFERLRNIKQLALANYVFPGATHTRLEHSIGTCHLAGELIRFLKAQQGSEYNIDDVDVLCTEIAALLHDIGHGPFSHSFEKVIHKLIEKEWKHEKFSLKFIDKIYMKLQSSFHKYGIQNEEIELIKDMIVFDGPKGDEKMRILHEKFKSKFEEKYSKLGCPIIWNKVFLFEIVSNHRNGIDVDKFDYFERDALNLGLKSNFLINRYILSTRIINVNGLPQICIKNTAASDLYQIFHTRDQLHRTAYQHKACIAIEMMLIDALVKADKVFNFKEIIEKCKIDEYCALTDDIYLKILNSNFLHNVYLKYASNIEFDDKMYKIIENIEKDMADAKQLLNRIETRKLYRFIGEWRLNDNSTIEDDELNTYKKEILNTVDSDTRQEINLEDLVFHKVVFDYGDGENNPIDNVEFYDKNDLNKHFKIKREHISAMLPSIFCEIFMRLYYTKESDNHSEVVKSLRIAFKKWKEQKHGSELSSIIKNTVIN